MAHPSSPLIALRRQAMQRIRRKRLGFWRSLGRSNRLFPRKLVVTREGKWIIGIALLLGAGAVNTGNNLLYLVLSLVISVISVSGLLSEWALRDLVLTRHYPRLLEPSDVSRLRIEVKNDKNRAALHMEVGELVDQPGVEFRPGYLLHLQPRETGQAIALLRPSQRGPLRTVGLQITTAYPFGFARKTRLFEDPAEFLVLPPVADVYLPWRGAAQRGAWHSSQQAGPGDTFRGLRDARPGDPLRDIHWKLSARRDRLIAREWEAESSRVAVVRFAHLSPHTLAMPQDLDKACAVVAGLCASLLRAGVAVALHTLQGQVAAQTDPGLTGDSLTQFRELLAQLVPADRVPPADWPVEDAPWLALAEQCAARATGMQAGEALQWPVISGPAEIFVVTFASRAEVPLGPADVAVTLADDGSLQSIRHIARHGGGV